MSEQKEGLARKVGYLLCPAVALVAGYFCGSATGHLEGFKEAEEIYRPLARTQARALNITEKGTDLLTRVCEELSNLQKNPKGSLVTRERLDKLYLELENIRKEMLEEQKRISDLRETNKGE